MELGVRQELVQVLPGSPDDQHISFLENGVFVSVSIVGGRRWSNARRRIELIKLLINSSYMTLPLEQQRPPRPAGAAQLGLFFLFRLALLLDFLYLASLLLERLHPMRRVL
jgi:hypothetical protein